MQYCGTATVLSDSTNNVWFQKISILPPQKGLEILGRRGVFKSQKFKAMYEAKLEFPEGWGGGGHMANPFRGGGMDIFWNHTIGNYIHLL